MNITEKEFQFLREMITRDLGCFLIDDFQMSLQQAIDAVYTSKTYELLGNPDSGLYFQSSNYVYQFLKEEITTGSFDMAALNL